MRVMPTAPDGHPPRHHLPQRGLRHSRGIPAPQAPLGCAISEAVEVATSMPGYRYVLGSVLNQVLLHQSVIGLGDQGSADKYGGSPT